VGIVGVSAVVFLITAGLISRYLGAIPLARALMLDLPQAATTPASAVPSESIEKSPSVSPPVSPAREVRVGDQGIADSLLRPAGKVQFGDRFVDVVSDGTFIDRGRPVRVVEISGNRVVVREVTTGKPA
jgi:membrane-bound serine protease (ClpP class)